MLSLASLAVDAAAAVPEDAPEGSDAEEVDEFAESNLKAHARSLRSVISTADILVQVLDARDPLGTRTLQLEKEIQQAVPAKKLVFVLNKVDLVPKENVTKWLEYLRRSFPTLPFKSSTQLQRTNLSSADSSATALLQLLKGFARGSAKSLTVGVIGLPNVGKSSLINTLKRKKACSVAPTPGWTKDVQTITLDGGLKILDCPGVVLASNHGEQSLAHQVLKGTSPIEQLDDVVSPVELLVSKCKKEHLMLLYSIPNFDTVQQFLVHVARAKGRLKKGGLPDVAGTARTIIRDWTAGRIPYFTVPPALPLASAATEASTSKSVMASESGAADEILSGFSAEFDIEALFKSADEAAFKETSTARGVAMAGTLADGNAEGEVRLLGEGDES
jgi:nuclear GTP-binding protein